MEIAQRTRLEPGRDQLLHSVGVQVAPFYGGRVQRRYEAPVAGTAIITGAHEIAGYLG
jgi:hypothetical protein